MNRVYLAASFLLPATLVVPIGRCDLCGVRPLCPSFCQRRSPQCASGDQKDTLALIEDYVRAYVPVDLDPA